MATGLDGFRVDLDEVLNGVDDGGCAAEAPPRHLPASPQHARHHSADPARVEPGAIRATSAGARSRSAELASGLGSSAPAVVGLGLGVLNLAQGGCKETEVFEEWLRGEVRAGCDHRVGLSWVRASWLGEWLSGVRTEGEA